LGPGQVPAAKNGQKPTLLMKSLNKKPKTKAAKSAHNIFYGKSILL